MFPQSAGWSILNRPNWNVSSPEPWVDTSRTLSSANMNLYSRNKDKQQAELLSRIIVDREALQIN